MRRGTGRKSRVGNGELVAAMCASLGGEPESAAAQVDHARRFGRIGGIDLVLAEKVVGSGADTGRVVTVEWDPVDHLTAWRFGLATATGMTLPDRLLDDASPQLRAFQARSPLLTPQQRLDSALFAAGLGGRLGSGEQWLAWIGLDDLLDVYHRALYDGRLAGPVNAVAPDPVRNADYTKALAGILNRPALLPVPSLGPRVLLGEQGARELAEANQRVVPTKLQTLGHRFRRPNITDALAHELGHG